MKTDVSQRVFVFLRRAGRVMTLRRAIPVLVLAALALLAGSCAFDPGYPVLRGTWHHDGGNYEEKWVITSTELEKYSDFDSNTPDYTFDVIDFGNYEWNGGETTDEKQNGYLVLKYKKAPSWNSDADGYIIFRWKNLTQVGNSLEADFSEGYLGASPDGAPDAVTAKSEYTDANGAFTMYSSPAVEQTIQSPPAQ